MSGRERPCLLAVLPDHPFPLEMGSRVRNLRILEALSGSFRLVILTLVHERDRLSDLGPVGDLGRLVPVLAPHRRSRLRQLLMHGRSGWETWTRGVHRETHFLSPPVLSQTARALLAEERPALVHAAYWFTLRHLPVFPRPPLWVVDTHDVQFERHEGVLRSSADRERQVELQELARYDRIVAITERDRETFRRHLPPGSPPVEVIGMGLDLGQWRRDAVASALPEARRITFYGNLGTEANRRGALHLLQDLVPLLRRKVPDLEVLILGAGADADPEIGSAAGAAGAQVHGFVPDVRPFLRSSRVTALSIEAGTGQRGRVVESLALGVPVVGYRGAVQGLEFREGEGVLAVDTPEEFCRTAARLLCEPEAAAAQGEAGRARVKECYGLESTYGKFPSLYLRLIEEAAVARQEGSR